MKGILSIGLLILSNFFMVFAWYSHLQFKKWNILQGRGIFTIILISWFIALFEYIFQVPGNRIGHQSNGGPFDLFQLKNYTGGNYSGCIFILCNLYLQNR